MKIKLYIDIETGDPDDLWTLAFLSTHPKIDLVGVTVFPGGRDQIGLVKNVLKLAGREDVLVGADICNDGKSRVGQYYYNWLGKIDPADPDEDLNGVFRKTHGSSLFTGGPVKNIWKIVKNCNKEKPAFDKWTLQGGYVGNSLLLPNQILPKFAGKETIATFNLNGDPKASLELLDKKNNTAKEIQMVGKNVCHGFWISGDNSAKITLSQIPKGKHPGLDLMINGIEKYCEKHSGGKAMHDLLAALLHINPEHGEWIEGNPYRKEGLWGFIKQESNIKALVGVNNSVIQEFY